MAEEDMCTGEIVGSYVCRAGSTMYACSEMRTFFVLVAIAK